MKEWWRNSSRVWTLEMCTSMVGIGTALMASWMATEVWVYAPALRMMPSQSDGFEGFEGLLPLVASERSERLASSPYPARWMRSMMSPSWFDWK